MSGVAGRQPVKLVPCEMCGRSLRRRRGPKMSLGRPLELVVCKRESCQRRKRNLSRRRCW